MERSDNTVRFLRMTAGQLRRLAERVPEIADELRTMAQQLEAEADDLASNPKPQTREPER
jgi:methyl-accepting chemotaxis protein